MAQNFVDDPARQCDGKRRYERKADAKRAIRSAEQSFGRMHPYRCPHCSVWHIGHDRRRARSTATANVMGPGVAVNDPGPDRGVEVPDG